MRLLLTRHGQSQGNINSLNYVLKGDWENGLTDTGWRQADANGRFLTEDYYPRTNTTKCPTIFISGYVRPEETFSAINNRLQSLFPGGIKPNEDPRLIEKYLGAAAHLAHAKGLSGIFKRAVFSFSRALNKQSPFTARAPFGESDKDIWIAVKSLLDGTLMRDIGEGKDDFLIVTHGRVIDTFLMIGAHLRIRDMKKLPKVGNCDIIEISGTPKNWSFRKIWDGPKKEECNLDALAGLKRFSVNDLPPVPDFLKRGL